MIELIGQCPCSGGGGRSSIDPLLAMAIIVGLFVFVTLVGSIRKQKGVSIMNKAAKIGIVVAVLVVVGVVIAMKTGKGDPAANQKAQTPVTSPADSASEGKLPRLVDIGSGRCIPCKMMLPILKELQREYAGRFEVEIIDLSEAPDAGNIYGIKLIPTQIFFSSEGGELWRHEGFMSREDILSKWKELGVDLSVDATKK